MKVLIIEDEPLAQEEIQRLLAQVAPEAEVVAVLDTIEDTVRLLDQDPTCADLALMDIELADGSAFQIFDQVQVLMPVVFTTAYNEHALRAFKVNSIDYLLKPVEAAGLQAAFNKYQALYQGKSATPALDADKLQQLIQSLSGPAGQQVEYKSRFVVMIGDKIKYVPVEEIAYFYADDNLVYLVQHDRKRYMVSNNLEQIETMVDPKHFFRVTRKYLANIKAIGDVYKHFNSRLKVMLNPAVDDTVLVSRVRAPEFMRWLGS